MEDTADPYQELLPDLLFFIFSDGLAAIPLLLFFGAMLFFSAFISASESAIFSTNRIRIEDLSRKSHSSKLLLQLLDSPQKLLASLMIINIFVNLIIVIIWPAVLFYFFPESYPAWFTVQLISGVFVVLIFGEILPRRVGMKFGLQLSLYMAKPLTFLSRILHPITVLFVPKPTATGDRFFQSNTEQEVLPNAFQNGTMKETASQQTSILRGIVRFGNISAREVMRSRLDVVALEIDTPFQKMLQTVMEAGYSRIPVYRESFDNIEGILYIKDLLPYLGKEEDFEWAKFIRPCVFVPESKKINNLLKEFQAKKIHMAVVVDEYGGVSGIVTLEDILEEIVGEINDEFDTEESFYTRIDSQTFVFEGKTQLKDFCQVTGCNMEVFDDLKGEADTLAGLILEQSQELPAVGERFYFHKFEMQVEGVDNRRIKKIRVVFSPTVSKQHS